MTDKSTWTLQQLKSALREHNARTTGRKAELLERLEFYEKNEDIQTSFIPMPAPVNTIPEWPHISKFSSITENDRENLPKITKGHIYQYVMAQQAKDVGKNSKDIAAVKRGIKMTNNVGALSIYNEALDLSSNAIEKRFFATGMVFAEYKENSYCIKLVLKSLTAEILNASCECATGRGPASSCKHVISSMMVLEKFVESGELSVEPSCTEQLQQFHKPKKAHKGKPVLAETMGRGLTDKDDPRPMSFRNRAGYNDFVRSKVISHCQHTGQDIAQRYAYKKANIQEATIDHHYFKVPFTEY